MRSVRDPAGSDRARKACDDGKAPLLWRFDCNPKTAKWEEGGGGGRNNILAVPDRKGLGGGRRSLIHVGRHVSSGGLAGGAFLGEYGRQRQKGSRRT